MPRIAGQIDLVKTEAILNAAAAALAERGLAAPLEDIARRAGVSKQTIYNHFGSKTELLRVLLARRVDAITAVLDMPGAEARPEEALASFAQVLLEGMVNPATASFLRVIALGAVEAPDLALTFYQAGPRSSRARLAQFLEQETKAGRLQVPDPALAAEQFMGMVGGANQLAVILGLGPQLAQSDIRRVAGEAARRFVRAYAP